MSVSRRKFLQGCCAGIMAMQGARLGNLAFGAPPSGTQDVIVSIFLRGGMDALSLLVPHGEDNYFIARAKLGIPSDKVLDLNGLHGLHPSAAGLFELVRANHLAIVCAAGSPDPTRSHFDAQDMMEHGITGDTGYAGGGWLARHVNRYNSNQIFQAISLSDSVAAQLDGAKSAIALENANGYTIQGDWWQFDDLKRSLRTMYGNDTSLGPTALNLLNATDMIEYAAPDYYNPLPGITYPGGGFGDSLKSLAQLIKLDMGLMAATMDLGGWDTHESQADNGNPIGGYFAQKIAELSNGLNAFWKDMVGWHGKLTVVVMSEFGRRLKENNNRGTDHGHGSIVLVLSKDVSRGGVFGRWPGLAPEQLFERVDLAITTDYRTVLSEILQARTQTQNIAQVFPYYTPPAKPLGLFGPRNSVEGSIGRGFLGLMD